MGNLDADALISLSIDEDAFGSDGSPKIRTRPRLEFTGGREVDTFFSFVPGDAALSKSIGRNKTSTQSVVGHPLFSRSDNGRSSH